MNEPNTARRRIWWRIALALPAVYAGIYGCRFVQVNRVENREYVMASELPEECRAGVELCGEPPETVGVWLTRTDIDGDGRAEWITDAGDYGRGAANSWYNIWKKQKDGTFDGIGEFYCDQYLAIPRPWIFGHPKLLCVESQGFTEWVPWKNGRYEGHDEIGR